MSSGIKSYDSFMLNFTGMVYFIVVLVGIVVAIYFLLKRCDRNYEDFEVYTDETAMTYIPPHKLLIKLLIHPKELIKTGQITKYDEGSLEVWFYASSILIGLIAIGLVNGVPAILKGIISIPLSIAIGRWFYVGLYTIGFRYIARVKLSYQEGKSVFGPIYWLQYIISIVLSYIQSLLPPQWGAISIGSPIPMGYSLSINIFAIAMVIWFSIISFLLLKYRYHLTGKQSVTKIILIYLSSFGITFILFMGLILLTLLLSALPRGI